MSYLKIIGTLLNALGAVILALRVKSILDMIVNAQTINDINFRVLSDRIEGKPQKAPVTLGMDEQVKKQQKRGLKLLVVGFTLIAIGNLLIGVSIYFNTN